MAYLKDLGHNQTSPHSTTSAIMAEPNGTGNWSNDHSDINGTQVSLHTDSMVSLNYDLPIMIIVAAVLFVVIIATAFGNLLVGLALFKFRYLRTISNQLIGNLALSDFLLATTILPMSTVQECLGHWVFGQFMCNFWLLSDVLYCTASIWNLCIIAFDRFTATLYPLWYREKRSNKQAAIYVALVWIISTAICLPPLFGWNDLNQNYVYNNETNVYNCNLFQTPSYVLYSAAGSFYIPFFITFFLYVRIFIVLRRRMRNMRRTANKRNQLQSSTAKKEPLLTSLPAPVPTPKQHSIEMTNAKSINEGSANTEELSSKSLFGSDSGDDDDDDEDSSQADKLLCPQDPQPHNGKSTVKNGIKGRLQGKGKASEKAAMLRTCSESESDMEKVRIVVTADNPIKDVAAEKTCTAQVQPAEANISASGSGSAVPIPTALVKDDNSNTTTKGKMNSALKSAFGKDKKSQESTNQYKASLRAARDAGHHTHGDHHRLLLRNVARLLHHLRHPWMVPGKVSHPSRTGRLLLLAGLLQLQHQSYPLHHLQRGVPQGLPEDPWLLPQIAKGQPWSPLIEGGSAWCRGRRRCPHKSFTSVAASTALSSFSFLSNPGPVWIRIATIEEALFLLKEMILQMCKQ